MGDFLRQSRQAAPPYAQPDAGSPLASAQVLQQALVAAGGPHNDIINGPDPRLARAQGMRSAGTPMGEGLRGRNPNSVAAAAALAEPVRQIVRQPGPTPGPSEAMREVGAPDTLENRRRLNEDGQAEENRRKKR